MSRILVDKMDKHQKSRWLALYDAVNIVADESEKKGHTFGTLPLRSKAFDDYVKIYSPVIMDYIDGKNKITIGELIN